MKASTYLVAEFIQKHNKINLPTVVFGKMSISQMSKATTFLKWGFGIK